jgi:hypothetical protein
VRRPAKTLEPFKVLGAVPVLRLADYAPRIDSGETGERGEDAFPDDPDLLGRVVSEVRHSALCPAVRNPRCTAEPSWAESVEGTRIQRAPPAEGGSRAASSSVMLPCVSRFPVIG